MCKVKFIMCEKFKFLNILFSELYRNNLFFYLPGYVIIYRAIYKRMYNIISVRKSKVNCAFAAPKIHS